MARYSPESTAIAVSEQFYSHVQEIAVPLNAAGFSLDNQVVITLNSRRTAGENYDPEKSLPVDSARMYLNVVVQAPDGLDIIRARRYRATFIEPTKQSNVLTAMHLTMHSAPEGVLEDISEETPDRRLFIGPYCTLEYNGMELVGSVNGERKYADIFTMESLAGVDVRILQKHNDLNNALSDLERSLA